MLDEAQLRQLVDLDGGQTGLLREMATLFKSETPRRLQAIKEGLEARNASGVMEAAHALKGASGLMGARIVFALARDMETGAKAGSLPPPGSSMEAWSTLAAAVSDAQAAIDNFLANPIP